VTVTNTSSASNASLWIPFGCGKLVITKRVIDFVVFIAVTVPCVTGGVHLTDFNSTYIHVPLYFLPFIMTAVIYIISLCFKIYKAVTGNTSASIGFVM